jgi:6-phosphofructokinase 2
VTERLLTLTPNPALDVWLTTPRFTPGAKLRTSHPRIDPGGGGINVSRVVRRLGGETCALYAAGGRTGDALAEALGREDVHAQRCTIEAETRENISVRETETGKVLRFVTPGPELGAEERDDLLDLLSRNIAGSSLVIGSGSLPGGAGDRFWAEAALRCGQGGARFVLDSHDAVVPALEEGVFCFRENRDAIEKIAGRDIGWPHGAADWAEEQVGAGAARIVVVTEGDKGAVLVSRDMRILQPPPKVTPESEVGAGDSFVGGFCLALAQGRGQDEALCRAVATAAATLLTEGTELCRADDVDRLVAGMEAAHRI